MSMIRLAGAEDDILVQLQILSDFSYAWHMIDQFTQLMQVRYFIESCRMSRVYKILYISAKGFIDIALITLISLHIVVADFYSFSFCLRYL